jgi:oxalate decarboxylase/phosphoglucose isomerase-like protein (cupin superfamily)
VTHNFSARQGTSSGLRVIVSSVIAAQRVHRIVNTGKTPLLFYFYKWQA